jgi:DNA-binding transcriptional LysR family regulator
MEMFELKYFLAVAQVENVNRAAEEIRVSPGSLSKAISRLEDELQTSLFFKSGRGIKLTPEGRLLKAKAIQILQLEEDARLELQGNEKGILNIGISSNEILQTSFGPKILGIIDRNFPNAQTRFFIRSEKQALDQLIDGDAHLAITTIEPPQDVACKTLAKVEFKVCASPRHPLVRKYRTSPVPIDEVLKHPFVSPESPILGRIGKASTSDGWRDDKFPRLIKYRVHGLKLMESLIGAGFALGYLPDYFVANAGLVAIKAAGCHYSCQQTVRILAKDTHALGWLGKLWKEL